MSRSGLWKTWACATDPSSAQDVHAPAGTPYRSWPSARFCPLGYQKVNFPCFTPCHHSVS